MIGNPGSVFDLVKVHAPAIYSGAGSVLCSLNNGTTGIGEGALLPTDDPNYDADDELRGIPSFTGVTYDPETGMMVSADQAELGVSQEAVTIGRPIKSWTGQMRNLDGTDLDFTVLEVMQDRTVGVYRLRLEVRKASGRGRRIIRSGEGGV
jgi:hypothetical protein